MKVQLYFKAEINSSWMSFINTQKAVLTAQYYILVKTNRKKVKDFIKGLFIYSM